jgi:hypothetical protein
MSGGVDFGDILRGVTLSGVDFSVILEEEFNKGRSKKGTENP